MNRERFAEISSENWALTLRSLCVSVLSEIKAERMYQK